MMSAIIVASILCTLVVQVWHWPKGVMRTACLQTQKGKDLLWAPNSRFKAESCMQSGEDLAMHFQTESWEITSQIVTFYRRMAWFLAVICFLNGASAITCG